jgi:hypothetical protein
VDSVLAEARTQKPQFIAALGSLEMWRRGNVIFILDAIPDDAPPPVREGIARRRMVTLYGVCPCGATFNTLPAASGRVRDYWCEHAPDCPAGDDVLSPAWRAWQAGRS